LSHGVRNFQFSPAKNVIKISLPVSDAQQLLNTTYSVFQNCDTEVIRTPEWSLPEHLHDRIVSIQPTTSFLHAKAKSNTRRLVKRGVDSTTATHPPTGDGHALPPDLASICNISAITLPCVRKLYKTID
jgi:tripeptidyl-peptidase-1